MKLIEDKLTPEKDYKELFTVEVNEIECTDTVVGMRHDGVFLYIKERLANSGNAYWMDREFYSIDEDEFNHFLEMAIESGKTTLEELQLQLRR